MATYRKSEKNGKIKLTEITPEDSVLTPKEAVEIIEEGAPYKVPVKPPQDKDQKEAALLGSTREAIQLRRAEIDGEIRLRKANLKGQIDTIKATESAKEKAGKHLAVFGALYLCTCVIAFLYSISMLESESIAVAATLITLVVTQLASILKTVVDTKEPKDPVELMSEIVHVTLGNDVGDEGKE